MTGHTRLLPAADRTAMEATSLTHLTAVSGPIVLDAPPVAMTEAIVDRYAPFSVGRWTKDGSIHVERGPT